MDHPSGLQRPLVLVCVALAWSALIAAPARGQSIVRFGVDGVTLGWTPPPGGIIDGYAVMVSTNGAPEQFTVFVTEPRATVSGRIGDRIVVRVYAVGRTAPGAPTKVSPPSEASLTIYFLPAPVASPYGGLLVLHCAGCPSVELRSLTRPELPYPVHAMPAPWRTTGIGAFDADGTSALWHVGNPGVLLSMPLAMPPAPPTAVGTSGLAGSQLLGLAELDGDAAPEIVLSGSDPTALEFWEVQDDRFVRLGSVYSPPGWRFSRAVDFDGDRVSEIWWQTDRPGQVEVWKLAGFRVVDVLARVDTGASGELVEVADFDGDGVVEPLWRTPLGALAITRLVRGGGNSFGSLLELLALPWIDGDWDLLVRGVARMDDRPGVEILVQDRWTYRVHVIYPRRSSIPLRSILFDVNRRAEIVQVR